MCENGLGAWGPLLVVGRRPLLVVGRREQGASPSHYYILLLVSLRACQAKAFPTEGGEREGAKGGEREYPGGAGVDGVVGRSGGGGAGRTGIARAVKPGTS